MPKLDKATYQHLVAYLCQELGIPATRNFAEAVGAVKRKIAALEMELRVVHDQLANRQDPR